jgi:hypothetical protein
MNSLLKKIKVWLSLPIICWLTIAPGYGQQKDAELAIGHETVIKEVATPLTNTLEKVRQLNGYTYFGKDQYGHKEQGIGLITREVEKVFPQLVNPGENGTKEIDYSGLIPVLIEAIKEQQLLIDQLLADSDKKEFDYQQLKETIKKQSELFKKQKKWLGELQEQNYQMHSDIEMLKMSIGLEASNEK